jgi:hypothetical protein
VETGLGAEGRTIAAMIEDRTTQDVEIVAAAGALLWRSAAWVLLDAKPPLEWETTGLSMQVCRPLARRIGALLFQADRLRHLTLNAAEGLAPPDAEVLRTIVDEVIKCDPDAQPMILALLLARIPEAAPALAKVAILMGQRGGASLRHAGEQAVDLLLDQLEALGGSEARMGGHDLMEAGASVRRLTSLLGALETEHMPPDRRDRLTQIRARIKTECQALFVERLSTDLLDPLRACSPDSGWELEAAARGLRALETEARRVGDDKAYDVLLRQAADMVRETTAQGGLDRVEGLRLMEIVAGPEAALALFGEAV